MMEITNELTGRMRHFVIDYEDEQGNEYNSEAYAAKELSNEYVIEGFIKELNGQGYIVNSIYEILSGSRTAIEAMAEHEPKKAAEGCKCWYIRLKPKKRND